MLRSLHRNDTSHRRRILYMLKMGNGFRSFLLMGLAYPSHWTAINLHWYEPLLKLTFKLIVSWMSKLHLHNIAVKPL